jgi:phosphatidylserine decarboxylase
MRFPFAEYGLRELLVAGGVLALAAIASLLVLPPLALVFLAALGLVVWFFRDPERRVPPGEEKLLAPADGRVVEISQMEEPRFIGGEAMKIGIFLSIFDVHLNRAPCRGRVAYLEYRPGRFKNALRAVASEVNESNSVGIVAENGRLGKVLVKQIAGAIARRIVCECKVDDALESGQRFGMIKLGSRTEIYVPASAKVRLQVQVGDKVFAGRTILGVVE